MMCAHEEKSALDYTSRETEEEEEGQKSDAKKGPDDEENEQLTDVAEDETEVLIPDQLNECLDQSKRQKYQVIQRLVVATSVFLLALGIVLASHFLNRGKNNSTGSVTAIDRASTIEFACPIGEDVTDIGSVERSWLGWVEKQIEVNASRYLETFRRKRYDGWGMTYRQFKEGVYSWKSRRFSDLRDGDSIYESACGIGLNLFLTLEILADERDLKNITVYGNEHVPEAVQVATNVTGRHLPSGARLGGICLGKSTGLDFIPSDSFDLVYTGYVTPLADPLNWGGSMDENYMRMRQLCRTERKEAQRVILRAQKRQNDWFGKWVGEMVRIAKPGAPVIVEQVAGPYCVSQDDWGGVNPRFWNFSIARYGWDIVPSSIEMEKDSLFKKRYNVFMRKTPKEE